MTAESKGTVEALFCWMTQHFEGRLPNTNHGSHDTSTAAETEGIDGSGVFASVRPSAGGYVWSLPALRRDAIQVIDGAGPVVEVRPPKRERTISP